MSFRALVEKSPAVETKPNIHKQSKYLPARAPRREIPRGRNETEHTRLFQNTCPWRLATEKSPAVETKPNIHEQSKYLPAGDPCRRDEGVPPYRRLRRESVISFFLTDCQRCHFERSREIPGIRNENNRTRTIQILARRGSLPAGRGRPALSTASPRIGYIFFFNRLSTMSFRALVEKSPATETKPNVHDHPKRSPAGAPCRTQTIKILARRGSLPRRPACPWRFVTLNITCR